MKRSILTTLVLWLGWCGCLGATDRPAKNEAAPTGSEATPATVWRLYSVHYLDLRDAGLLIEARIPGMLMQGDYELRYEGTGPDAGSRGYLRVLTDPASHSEIAAVLAEADRPPASHLFQIVLLTAVEDVVAPPDLPPGAARALDELRALLPFKGYRLIDLALVRSSGRSNVSLNSNHGLEMAFRVGPSQDKQLQVEHFALYSHAGGGGGVKHMETSFSAGIGETVVVGTSTPRDSGRALVVLLTALE